MPLSRWIANTKRVLAKDKKTGTEYEFETVFPDGAPDGTAFSAVEMNKIIDAVNQNAPAGGIIQYAGSAAPTGWLLCRGQAVSRATYPSLFAAIGTTYGTGDGTTTFNLPNLKGRVPVGYDSSQGEFSRLGKTGGEKTHQLTHSEQSSWDQGQAEIAHSYGMWVHHVTEEHFTSAVPHNNLQPYLVLNYIIKY